MSADYRHLRQRALLEQQLAGYPDIKEAAGLWNGLKTRVDEVEKALKFQTSIAMIVSNLASAPEEIGALRVPLEKLIGEGNALLEQGGPIAAAGEVYINAWGALQLVTNQLAAAGSFRMPTRPPSERWRLMN